MLHFGVEVGKEKDPRFILGAKPGDHELLFSWLEASEPGQTWERRDRGTGTVHRFEWDHGLPLNDANFDLKVNMLRYEETDSKGKEKRFPWVTDLPTLAMPAFLIDQMQQHRCPLFGRARRRQGRNLYLCSRLREPGRTFAFPDWRTPCRAIAGQLGGEDYVGLIRAGRWPP